MITITRANPASVAIFHIFWVLTCIPLVAEITTTAVSTAFKAPIAPLIKSGYPGVSITLISLFCQLQCSTEESMVVFLSFSSESKSETEVPSSTQPRRFVAPALNSIPSTSEVFPDAPCPTNATFLISFVSYCPIVASL